MVWPDGIGTSLHLVGRARDLVTTRAGDAVVVDEAAMHAVVDIERRITAIEATPPRPGHRGRSSVRRAAPTSAARSTPRSRASAKRPHRCTCMLDDIAGTSLIAGFVWTRHMDPEEFAALRQQAPSGFGQRKGKIICSGLRPGGSAQAAFAGETESVHAIRTAGPLVTDDDDARLARVPRAAGREHAASSSRRHHARRRRLRDRRVLPRQLLGARRHRDGAARVQRRGDRRRDRPHVAIGEGHAARAAVPRVPVGARARRRSSSVDRCRRFRTDVQTTLTELQACTHLNDMLRCLTEVPALAAAIAATALTHA